MAWFLLIFARFGRGLGGAFRDEESRQLLVGVVILLMSGTFFYSRAEGWSVVDSLYFTIVSLTTVGYGDLAPQTVAGKIFTMIYLLSGISLLLAFINLVAHRGATRPLLGRIRTRREANEEGKGSSD